MSKAFTSEETPDSPLLAPARAPLPDGVPNYVTPRGLAALHAELVQLEQSRAAVVAGLREGAQLAAELELVQRQLAALEERIASAELVPPATERDSVRFGARVTVSDEDEQTRSYTIVGVDEADAAHGLIAFSAPLARALLGKRVGDSVTVRKPRQEQELTVIAIE